VFSTARNGDHIPTMNETCTAPYKRVCYAIYCLLDNEQRDEKNIKFRGSAVSPASVQAIHPAGKLFLCSFGNFKRLGRTVHSYSIYYLNVRDRPTDL